MNNIYVDFKDLDVEDLPHYKCNKYTLQVRSINGGSDYKNVNIKSLSDRLAEERKIVCNQAKVDIRSLFNSYASSLIDYCIWNKNADENQKLYNNFKRIINDRLVKVLDLFDKRIDQIERGE